MVDNIKVAQFIYLLLNNQEIRDVIDTIGRKGVLLLGRFTGGRIAVLERLQEELRKRGFVPMVFNFDKPEVKDFTETVRLLAGLSHFVIADITSPRSANGLRKSAISYWLAAYPESGVVLFRRNCLPTVLVGLPLVLGNLFLCGVVFRTQLRVEKLSLK